MYMYPKLNARISPTAQQLMRRHEDSGIWMLD
jgi:hypothetical protein